MVIIKNIQIVGSVVSFEYYPEDRCKKGVFKFNQETKEVIEHIKSEENEWSAYIYHAYLTVLKIIEEGKEIPRTKMVAWY